MRAVVKVDTRPGPEGTVVREMPLPVPGTGQVRLRVRAAAICGSDRHIWHWDPSVRHLVRPPRIYGHEFCGEVDELGPNTGRTDLAPGDYVSAEMHVVCGTCRQCRSGQAHTCRNTRILGFHDDGSFAEFLVVPAGNVIRLDRRVVPLKVGAFLDALGNAVHTVQDHDLAGARVAVLGYGPIGAMAAAIAHHQGAERIYVLDVSQQAIEQAQAWRARKGAVSVTVIETGGDHTAQVDERILDETEGGVDLVLEMSGAESAINQGLRIARMGGTLSMLGIPGREAITIEDFARDFIFKGLTLQAIIGRRMFSTWERMLELLADGLDVAPLVSHEYESLDAFEEGMRAFDAHEALKVVFYPHGNGASVDTPPGGRVERAPEAVVTQSTPPGPSNLHRLEPGLIGGLERELDDLREAGTYKIEHELEGPQGPRVTVDGRPVVMLTSNNYLGLADHPRIVEAARETLEEWGFGMASVRFICGTQTLHRRLERRIADFFEVDDAVLYTSCWNANEALFAAVLGEDDAVYSDELNHASIIDGIRLCKAQRNRYPHADLDALAGLLAADRARHRIVVTDGVFSMEGALARIPELIDVCREHDALLVVDDSHGTGTLGERGRGTAEELGVHGQVDVVTGTLGKALGGAAGGFVAGPSALVDMLRQRSRPYLFSNSLPPPIVGASLAAFDLLDESPELVRRLRENTRFFRDGLRERGFDVPNGIHPVVPILVGETALAITMSRELLDEGVYVSGFGFPVVPHGEARLRAQISAAHEREELTLAIDAIVRVGSRHGVVG